MQDLFDKSIYYLFKWCIYGSLWFLIQVKHQCNWYKCYSDKIEDTSKSCQYYRRCKIILLSKLIMVHPIGIYLYRFIYLGHGHKIGNMGLARCGCAPVDLQVTSLQHLVNSLLPQYLLHLSHANQFINQNWLNVWDSNEV